MTMPVSCSPLPASLDSRRQRMIFPSRPAPQAKGYCASRGWEIVAEYVEPGLSATDDRRPEFQRMIDAATTKPPAFDVILVHSFSRSSATSFSSSFTVRRLAKLVSAGVDHPGPSVTIHEQHDPPDHGAGLTNTSPRRTASTRLGP